MMYQANTSSMHTLQNCTDSDIPRQPKLHSIHWVRLEELSRANTSKAARYRSLWGGKCNLIHTDNHNYARTDPERSDIYISLCKYWEIHHTSNFKKENPNRIERWLNNKVVIDGPFRSHNITAINIQKVSKRDNPTIRKQDQKQKPSSSSDWLHRCLWTF